MFKRNFDYFKSVVFGEFIFVQWKNIYLRIFVQYELGCWDLEIRGYKDEWVGKEFVW